MIERGVAEDLEAGMHGSAFGILAAIDEACDSRLNHGSRTHRAWLDRDVNRDAVQSIISERFGRGAQGHDFRMSARITIGDGAVPRARQELVAEHDNATDGHFAAFGRGPRLRERKLHAFEIVHCILTGQGTRQTSLGSRNSRQEIFNHSNIAQAIRMTGVPLVNAHHAPPGHFA
jgi:hypothetical protein